MNKQKHKYLTKVDKALLEVVDYLDFVERIMLEEGPFDDLMTLRQCQEQIRQALCTCHCLLIDDPAQR